MSPGRLFVSRTRQQISHRGFTADFCHGFARLSLLTRGIKGSAKLLSVTLGSRKSDKIVKERETAEIFLRQAK